MAKVLVGDITGPKGDAGSAEDLTLDAVLEQDNESDQSILLRQEISPMDAPGGEELVLELSPEAVILRKNTTVDGSAIETDEISLWNDGSGSREFYFPPEGGDIQVDFGRSNVLMGTGSLAAGARYSGTVALGSTFHLVKVTVNKMCRVRLYGSTAAATIDAGRGYEDPDPEQDHQLIYDREFTAASTRMYPQVVGSSNDGSNDIAVLVDNTDLITQNVQVTFVIERLK